MKDSVFRTVEVVGVARPSKRPSPAPCLGRSGPYRYFSGLPKTQPLLPASEVVIAEMARHMAGQ